jgi:hypothetical protein
MVIHVRDRDNELTNPVVRLRLDLTNCPGEFFFCFSQMEEDMIAVDSAMLQLGLSK